VKPTLAFQWSRLLLIGLAVATPIFVTFLLTHGSYTWCEERSWRYNGAIDACSSPDGSTIPTSARLTLKHLFGDN
jgi:hypothetical protein